MNIWLIDHYGVPPKYYPLAKPTLFAKYLIKAGHNVKIFAASSVHNSNINLLTENINYKEIIEDGINYVLIKCHQYNGNGIKRIINMQEFSFKLKYVCNRYKRPDVIIATSMTLSACARSIKLAKKYGCKKIAQIGDLWPESLVAYKLLSKYNPIVIYMRHIEKWIYKNADRVIFYMRGGYDYINERRWNKQIPASKIAYINNGVDLKQFRYNVDHYVIDDDDLINNKLFKVVYVGSIRMVNNVGILLDAAKLIKNKKIKILIWGEGDERSILEKRIIDDHIDNVVFKGKVDKKFIPYIVSKSNLNIIHNTSTPILKYGMSMNKIFDYLAAGKPILTTFYSNYNPVVESGAGMQIINQNPKEIAYQIDRFASMENDDYSEYCKKASEASKRYDYEILTNELIDVINSINNSQ